MSLAHYVLYPWFTFNQMAAMLDFAKMAAPSGARFSARQKCKSFGLVDLWAKVGAFGRIWTKQSLYCPNTPGYKQCVVTVHFSLDNRRKD